MLTLFQKCLWSCQFYFTRKSPWYHEVCFSLFKKIFITFCLVMLVKIILWKLMCMTPCTSLLHSVLKQSNPSFIFIVESLQSTELYSVNTKITSVKWKTVVLLFSARYWLFTRTKKSSQHLAILVIIFFRVQFCLTESSTYNSMLRRVFLIYPCNISNDSFVNVLMNSKTPLPTSLTSVIYTN